MNGETRTAFKGKPKEYVDYLKQVIRRYEAHFENVHKGLGNLSYYPISKTEYEVSLGGYGIQNPGQKVADDQFPLQFHDGSVFTIAQTITFEHGACQVKESVIRFIKVDAQSNVQYVFHYDTVIDIPDHPDHHLQFEFDPDVQTPRFPLSKYEDVDTILQMIVRDRIV